MKKAAEDTDRKSFQFKPERSKGKIKLHKNSVRIWVDEEEAIRSSYEELGSGTVINDQSILDKIQAILKNA
ncbi:MAG: hypothetical protein R3213_00840 [Flavobacteriaceae bacterium]|nr:hypothetical protein [Flavobacteriaceae bacterium]